jgi:hypothetical protein
MDKLMDKWDVINYVRTTHFCFFYISLNDIRFYPDLGVLVGFGVFTALGVGVSTGACVGVGVAVGAGLGVGFGGTGLGVGVGVGAAVGVTGGFTTVSVTGTPCFPT